MTTEDVPSFTERRLSSTAQQILKWERAAIFSRTPGTINGPRSALEPWQSHRVVSQIGHSFFFKSLFFYKDSLQSCIPQIPAWAYWLSSFIREYKQVRHSSSKITTMEMYRLMQFIGMAIAALLFITPFASAQSPSPAPALTSDGFLSLSLSLSVIHRVKVTYKRRFLCINNRVRL